MVTKISATEARSILGELLAKVGYGGERFVLERRGKPLAALISIDDLHRLESIESQEAAHSPELARETAGKYTTTPAVESAVESELEVESQYPADTLRPSGTMPDIDHAFASLAGIWQHLSDDDIQQMEQVLLEMRQQTADRLATLMQIANDD